MKASELKEQIDKLISEHGDLDIKVLDNEWGPCHSSGIVYTEGKKSDAFPKENEPATFVIY